MLSAKRIVSGVAALAMAGVLVSKWPAWTQAHEQQAAPAAHGAAKRNRIALTTALPHLDGSHLKATVVEVNYGPGKSSPPHSHPCVVVGYVAAGSIRSQVQGGPAVVYQTGESFYEEPNGVHLVSQNASRTEPARLVAYILCDHEAPLSVDVPGGGATKKE